ncbi:Uu.00g143980.m01.CDS01 [Anthostomella pinea]|uniref:Uu.00g143980.m01.CDS01 n=1 Tax=Anthostomella pinea TaxID=933095 RepID=A0AAI8VRY5_9PEZI|nr:Uu.00g143980.m01.CDS01 [Anthostomella pinea]
MDPTLLILDVREKEATEPKAPSFPQIKSSTSGFPEHKKRKNKVSAFKQKRQQGVPLEEQKTKVFLSSSKEPLSASSSQHDMTQKAPPTSQSFESNEQRRIDRENAQRLASMAPEDIEEARKELFSDLDPAVLQMLLKRATLDVEPTGPSPFDEPSTSQPTQDQPEIRIEDTSIKSTTKDPTQNSQKPSSPKGSARVPPPAPTVTDEADESEATHVPTQRPTHTEYANDPTSDQILSTNTDQAGPKPHWPQPPQPADLDPSDPNFLQNLHEKYFPSLPADPSKLAWMAPLPTPNSAADHDSPYHPDQDSLPISALRFDFRGMLLPPRIARAIPTSKGLHHHGEAPEAAGYTIRELARLQRSAVPGQRCVAHQTLGRVLYRLGRGEFGRIGDDGVADGVWRQCEEGAVMRNLYEEAGTEEGSGHRSARAFAIEAVWLFEKGGWKERLRRAK